MSLQAISEEFLGRNTRVRFVDWRGQTWGPTDAPVTVRFNSADAVKYFVRSPGELGLGRAYVSGAMDIDGDIWSLLDLERNLGGIRFTPRQIRALAKLVGVSAWTTPPPVPAEEIGARSRLTAHSRKRDRTAIDHHYNVSNDFYRLILGPSMVYSCGVFEQPSDTLQRAQSNKLELICRKLGLEPGMRLLDVGCGWGGMVIHAAKHYGVEAVGITISESQAALARERVAEAGLSDQVTIRLQDYRDLEDGPFDAISSIGMFEHVGLAHLSEYFRILRRLLPHGGRLLNHQIGRTPFRTRVLRRERVAVARHGFIQRYVFPDGELHEIGDVVGAIQRANFEARHMESIREHYALTLRHWVSNLEANWDEAVAEIGEGRARVWRLYMAATSVNFAIGKSQVHQVLAVNTSSSGQNMGRSCMPLRPRWDSDLAATGVARRAKRPMVPVDGRSEPTAPSQDGPLTATGT